MLFQNPAEVRSAGGIPGALALLHTDNGRIDLVQQATSTDFPQFAEPVLELPIDTKSLYGTITGEFIQDVTLTPRFPLTGALAREMWLQRYGLEVDGVIAVDPQVLSYLLAAAGPVTLSTGDVLSSDNAVQMLLSEVYARFSDPGIQNAFFAEAASASFSQVTSGAGEPKALIEAFARAGNERRILIWSAREEDQYLLGDTLLAGDLPVSDPTVQRFGVYQNESTASKMDYYLTTDIVISSSNCRNDGRATMTLDVTLTNTAPLDAATSLPPYVTGAAFTGFAGGEYDIPPGLTRTIVSVYGPPGAINQGASATFEDFAVHPTVDGEYPVTSVQIQLAPGESKTVQFTMLTEFAFRGEVEATATPGVNTSVTNELLNIC